MAKRSGFILCCGQMFFGSLVLGRLTLTSTEKEAWFTEDNVVAHEMSTQLLKAVGLVCVIASYVHGSPEACGFCMDKFDTEKELWDHLHRVHNCG